MFAASPLLAAVVGLLLPSGASQSAAMKEQEATATLANEWWSAQLVLGQSNVSGVRANATFVNLQAQLERVDAVG